MAAKPDADRPYHHGDLHNACVKAALALVRDAGLKAITLRGVAERIGVSRSAPYRHFSSKRDLLAASAEHGFVELTRQLREAIENSGGSDIDRLYAGIAAYASFGASNPDLYRLMFGSDMTEDEYPALAEVGAQAFEVLLEGLRECQASGSVKPDDPHEQAVTIWSAAHGVVNLYIDSKPSRVLDTTALLDNVHRVLATILRGVAA